MASRRAPLPALEGCKQAAVMLSRAARGAACWLGSAAVALTLFAALSDVARAGGTLVVGMTRLGQPDGISPSRMAEMLEVDKAGPKVRC